MAGSSLPNYRDLTNDTLSARLDEIRLKPSHRPGVALFNLLLVVALCGMMYYLRTLALPREPNPAMSPEAIAGKWVLMEKHFCVMKFTREGQFTLSWTGMSVTARYEISERGDVELSDVKVLDINKERKDNARYGFKVAFDGDKLCVSASRTGAEYLAMGQGIDRMDLPPPLGEVVCFKRAE
jgi:hypothetical protein